MGGLGGIGTIASLAGGGKSGGGSSGGIGPNAQAAAQASSQQLGNFYADAGLGTSSMATAARSLPFVAAAASSDAANQADLGNALTELAALRGTQSVGGGQQSGQGSTPVGGGDSGGTSTDPGGLGGFGGTPT